MSVPHVVTRHPRRPARRRPRNPWRSLARRRWPRALWIAGDGPVALVAHCALTVTLWPDDGPAAQAAKRLIDGLACGHRCRGPAGHEFVRLDTTAEVLTCETSS